MSVDLTHYFGIGLKLADKPDFDLLETYPQYSVYEFERKTTNIKTNVRVIVDGMCGEYAYLMYVFKETEGEAFWNADATKEIVINTIESLAIINELKEAYFQITSGEELNTAEVNLISLFHSS